MRVLGIDPGSSCTGFAIVDERENRTAVVASGVIRAPAGPLPGRLAYIYSGLEELLGAHRPDAVAVEAVFTARNARSALVLGHARGVALLAAERAGIAVFEYPTRQVKKTVTGSGSADKEQVRRVLQLLLGEAPAQLDASDALAVAICHLHSSGPIPARRRRR